MLKLNEGEYVFCKTARSVPYIMAFLEEEGRILILDRKVADENSVPYKRVWAWMTMPETELDIIGFLARVTKALAEQKIPVNVVSAFHHDHLFVPYELKGRAIAVLKWV